MVGKVQTFVEKHIVAEVPPELAACLDCGWIQCLNEKWETCPNRLAHAASINSLNKAADQSPESPVAEANAAE